MKPPRETAKLVAQLWWNGQHGAATEAIEQCDAEARAERPLQDAGLVGKLRAEGWMVAVHNDYRQGGEAFTFWLFTHADGRWIKGEGRTDDEAIAAAYRTSKPTPTAVPACPEWCGYDIAEDTARRVLFKEGRTLYCRGDGSRAVYCSAACRDSDAPTPTRAVPVRAGRDAGTLPNQPDTPQRETLPRCAECGHGSDEHFAAPGPHCCFAGVTPACKCERFAVPSALGQVEGKAQKSDPARPPTAVLEELRDNLVAAGTVVEELQRARKLSPEQLTTGFGARPPTAETCGTCGGSKVMGANLPRFPCPDCANDCDHCDGLDGGHTVRNCPGAATEGGKP